MLKNEPKPVQNNTLCTIVVFCVGVGIRKGSGRPVRVFRLVGIEVVFVHRSEGNSCEKGSLIT